jgi:hypothetical protein
MGEQQFRRQPGLVHTLFGEKSRRPFQQSADGPCPGGFSHCQSLRGARSPGKPMAAFAIRTSLQALRHKQKRINHRRHRSHEEKAEKYMPWIVRWINPD